MSWFHCSFPILTFLTVYPAVSLWTINREQKGFVSIKFAVLFRYPSLLLFFTVISAHAQRQRAELDNRTFLPDAPQVQSASRSPVDQDTAATGSASVSGVVLDATGAAVPGAQVSLTDADGKVAHTIVSGGNGEFTFSMLPAAPFRLLVDAKGFAPFISEQFSVSRQQSYQLPQISLTVASASTDVLVRPTEVIAAEQMKAEEKQRLIGIFPNFYVSYFHDPAPLTAKQKFSLASRDTFDWTSFVGISIAAGIEQANNSYAGYGKGPAGYGKRWAAQFGDGRTSDFLGHAVFPVLFHQDPRYFYQGTGTFKSRLVHALGSSVIARSDKGRPMPAYSDFLGDVGSGALSNLYYPHADRGLGLVFTNAAIGIAGKAASGVLKEFLSKQLTRNVPADAKP